MHWTAVSHAFAHWLEQALRSFVSSTSNLCLFDHGSCRLIWSKSRRRTCLNSLTTRLLELLMTLVFHIQCQDLRIDNNWHLWLIRIQLDFICITILSKDAITAFFVSLYYLFVFKNTWEILALHLLLLNTNIVNSIDLWLINLLYVWLVIEIWKLFFLRVLDVEFNLRIMHLSVAWLHFSCTVCFILSILELHSILDVLRLV